MTFHPCPKPRPQILEREARKAQRERDAARVRAEVRERDGWRCRVCGRAVALGAVLPARRAEVHHLAPRALAPGQLCDPATQMTVCGLCHAKLTAHELECRGTNQARVHVMRGPNFRPGR